MTTVADLTVNVVVNLVFTSEPDSNDCSIHCYGVTRTGPPLPPESFSDRKVVICVLVQGVV